MTSANAVSYTSPVRTYLKAAPRFRVREATQLEKLKTLLSVREVCDQMFPVGSKVHINLFAEENTPTLTVSSCFVVDMKRGQVGFLPKKTAKELVYIEDLMEYTDIRTRHTQVLTERIQKEINEPESVQ